MSFTLKNEWPSEKEYPGRGSTAFAYQRRNTPPLSGSPHGFVGRGGAAERVSFAACGETNDTQLETTRQEAFSGRTAKEKWREHMRENPYKRLPPIERRPDGTLCRMTPAQRKQANALIRRECCNYEDGNCMLLDDGDAHTCPQAFLSRSAASGSAGRSCRKSERWKQRFSGIRS